MDGKDKRLLNDTLSEITGTRHYSSVGEMLSAKFEELGEKDDNGNPVVYENPLKSTDGSSFSVTIPPEGCYRGPVAYGFDPPDAVWTDSRAFEDFAISCFEQNRPDTNNQYYHGLGFSLAEHRDTAGSYKSSPSVIDFAKVIWDSSISSGGAGKVTDALFLLGDRTEDDVRFVLCVSSLDPENDMKAYLEEKPSPYAGFTLKGVEKNSLNSVALYYTVDDFTLNPKDIVADRLGFGIDYDACSEKQIPSSRYFGKGGINLIDELVRKGWSFSSWTDGSGGIDAPDGSQVLGWDLTTSEIWKHGGWDRMDNFDLAKEVWNIFEERYPEDLKQLLNPFRGDLSNLIEWRKPPLYSVQRTDGIYRAVYEEDRDYFSLPDVHGTFFRVKAGLSGETGEQLYTLNKGGAVELVTKPSTEAEINDFLIDKYGYNFFLEKSYRQKLLEKEKKLPRQLKKCSEKKKKQSEPDRSR